MTRAVFFDVDGVLVHGYHARPEQSPAWYATLLSDLGIDPDRFRTEFIYDIFIKRVLIGEIPMIEALDQCLPNLGYDGSPLIVLRHWLTYDTVLDHDLVALVRQLKARTDVKLYLATNQDHARALWLWELLDMHDVFDDMFYSARAGIRKPEPGFFDFITDRIGPQTETPLFFDDTPKVIAGARAYGWEAVEYNALVDFTGHPWVASQLRSPV